MSALFILCVLFNLGYIKVIYKTIFQCIFPYMDIKNFA